MTSTPTVLVTGASRGLGLSLVEALLEQGFRVFSGHRAPSPALAALEKRSGGRLSLVLLDVTDADSVRQAAAAVSERSSALDILVNNAAILPSAGRGVIEEMDIEIGRELYDVNALGPLRVTQALLPLLRRGTGRRIVNISSEAGSIGECWRKDEFLYCMSKAALNMQTAILKNYLSSEGFQLLALHPGWLRTDMGGPSAHLDPMESANAIAQLIQSPRIEGDASFLDYTGKELRW